MLPENLTDDDPSVFELFFIDFVSRPRDVGVERRPRRKAFEGTARIEPPPFFIHNFYLMSFKNVLYFNYAKFTILDTIKARNER